MEPHSDSVGTGTVEHLREVGKTVHSGSVALGALPHKHSGLSRCQRKMRTGQLGVASQEPVKARLHRPQPACQAYCEAESHERVKAAFWGPDTSKSMNMVPKVI